MIEARTLVKKFGGRTALNLVLALVEGGVLAAHEFEMLGARPHSSAKAEDRSLFKAAMERIGLTCPRASAAHSIEEAWAIVRERSPTIGNVQIEPRQPRRMSGHHWIRATLCHGCHTWRRRQSFARRRRRAAG